MGISISNLRRGLGALIIGITAVAASAGESTRGPLFEWSGVVKKVYFKDGNRYGVLMSDAAGNEAWLFTKSGPQALAVLLSQKALQTPTRVIFVKNPANHDQQSCIDIPYERWVCHEIHYIEAE